MASETEFGPLSLPLRKDPQPDTLSGAGEGLKPCPFCEAPSKLIEPRDSAPYVICTRCHCGGPVDRSAGSTEAIAAWNRRPAPKPVSDSGREAVVREMVERFLRWRLPENFAPDGGVVFYKDLLHPSPAHWPVGTNLLDFAQAEAMVRYMLGDDQ